MKSLFSIVLLSVLSCAIQAQNKSKKIPDILSEKHWAFIPKQVELTKNSSVETATKRVERGNFYISKYEVTTNEYRRFLASLSGGEKEVHKPNRDGWKKLVDANVELVQYYQNHRGFDNYPVVNVTKENAEAFAVWLTQEYNGQKKRKFKKVSFRLPTELEWETAARGDHPEHIAFPWGSPYIRDREGKYLANILKVPGRAIKNSWDDNGSQKFEVIDNNLSEILSLTTPIASYRATQFGLFDMVGNVAEMTISEHPEQKDALISKGGSYALSEYWAPIDSQYPFQDSNAFTGFRLVMEVIEK